MAVGKELYVQQGRESWREVYHAGQVEDVPEGWKVYHDQQYILGSTMRRYTMSIVC